MDLSGLCSWVSTTYGSLRHSVEFAMVSMKAVEMAEIGWSSTILPLIQLFDIPLTYNQNLLLYIVYDLPILQACGMKVSQC